MHCMCVIVLHSFCSLIQWLTVVILATLKMAAASFKAAPSSRAMLLTSVTLVSDWRGCHPGPALPLPSGQDPNLRATVSSIVST